MTDHGMTPVPTHALTALWHAIDDARESMERAQAIENANHDYDPDCHCEYCQHLDQVDCKVGDLLVDAALAFRDACEGVKEPVAAPQPRLKPAGQVAAALA